MSPDAPVRRGPVRGPVVVGRRRGVGPVARGAAVVLAVLALAGCRLGVDTGLEVTANGSGTLAVVVDLDEELVESLSSTGFDPTPDAVPGWEVERTSVDGGDRVAVRTTFDTPEELDQRVADLGEGLGQDDPGLLDSVDLVVESDGSTAVEAAVGLRLPSSTGVQGPGFADAAVLEALASDPESFEATFTLTLPGSIEDHNADVVRGNTALWELAAGEDVVARASAGPPELLDGWVLTAILVGVLALLVGLGTWLLRRRRREQHEAPYGRVGRL